MSEIPFKANIIVVDDTRANLRFLTEILTQQGYAVRPATNGQMALSSVQARPPDLILLDIMMPDMDGYEVCTRLKSDDRTSDIPIIFLSALNEVEDKVRAFEIGGVDYITKPFQMEEVLARVHTHLALRELQQRLEAQNARLQKEIIERERAQHDLELYAHELEDSNAELDAFAHTVAHDLKTPLTAMIGFSALLWRRCASLPLETICDRLELITQTGHKMTNIINELLLLASVRKVEEVELGILRMDEIIAEVLKRFETEIESAAATIDVAKTWPAAIGYAPWVEEVWVNYVSNALKYGGAPEEGRPPHVTLGADMEATASGPRFWVRDNGPGLSADEQSQLFAQFTRLHEVRAEGHGLGLSIVQRIVAKLGGDVGVASDGAGQGCTFWFVLPAAG